MDVVCQNLPGAECQTKETRPDHLALTLHTVVLFTGGLDHSSPRPHGRNRRTGNLQEGQKNFTQGKTKGCKNTRPVQLYICQVCSTLPVHAVGPLHTSTNLTHVRCGIHPVYARAHYRTCKGLTLVNVVISRRRRGEDKQTNTFPPPLAPYESSL